jgi:hypothetical protein
MTTLLVLLTPVLLLAIVALFAFVGCSFTPGEAGYQSFNPVVQIAAAGNPTVKALLDVEGASLLVATVQWGGKGAPQFSAQVGSGAPEECHFKAASEVNNGNPYNWNGMNIQVFTGQVPAKVDVLVVTVTLPDPSPVDWSICIWPYATASQKLYGAVSSSPNFASKTITTQAPVHMNGGDVLYAVAFAADTPSSAGSPGAFPGNNTLSAPAGWGFATASDRDKNPLLIGFGPTVGPGELKPVAVNATSDTNPLGFILAFGVTIT